MVLYDRLVEAVEGFLFFIFSVVGQGELQLTTLAIHHAIVMLCMAVLSTIVNILTILCCGYCIMPRHTCCAYIAQAVCIYIHP